MVISSVTQLRGVGAWPRGAKDRFAKRIGEHVVEEEIQYGEHTGMSAARLIDWNLRHSAELKHHGPSLPK